MGGGEIARYLSRHGGQRISQIALVSSTVPKLDADPQEAHYNGRRPHRSRKLRPPRPGHPVADLSQERIQRRPVLGGLISEYERAA